MRDIIVLVETSKRLDDRLLLVVLFRQTHVPQSSTYASDDCPSFLPTIRRLKVGLTFASHTMGSEATGSHYAIMGSVVLRSDSAADKEAQSCPLHLPSRS
jgi:hypothetical protein